MKIFNKYLYVFIIIMLFITLNNSYVYCSEGIEIPQNIEITKENDLSGNLLSRLFGDVFTAVASPQNSNLLGNSNIYSGLIINILSVLNVCALVIVSITILYYWGIGAVTTAHEGRRVGGIYNSFWVPIRSALAFSLIVPIFKGISVLQLIILMLISLSINFANGIWDASGKYLVDNTNVGIIDSYVINFEKEVYYIAPPIFQDLVIQEIVLSKNFSHGANASYDLTNSSLVKNDQFTAENSQKYMENGGKIVEIVILDGKGKENNKGLYQLTKISDYTTKEIEKVTISLRNPKALQFYSMDITIPKMSSTKNLTGDNAAAIVAILNFQEALQNQKVLSFIQLSEHLRPYVQQYLKAEGGKNAIKFDGYNILPLSTTIYNDGGLNFSQIAEIYVKSMSDLFKEQADEIKQITSNATELLTKAIDNEDGKSRFGWVSAGMFSFSLASYQKIFTNALNSDTIIESEGSGTETQGALSRLFDSQQSIFDDFPFVFSHLEQLAIKNSQKVFNDSFLLSTNYRTAESQKSQGFKGVNTFLGKVFLESSSEKIDSNNGYLAVIIDRIGKYDPLVLLSYYGQNLVNAALVTLGTGTILDTFLGSGGALLSLGLTLFFCGVILGFVAPLIPLIFWLKALLSWLFLVVETMVAAPFWACSHASPEGEGFAGRQAKIGYIMLLDILIRPLLLVIGAVFAIAIMQSIGWLFSIILGSWFGSVGVNFLGIGTVADFVFSIIVLAILFYISIFVYTKGINYMPERVIKWLGGVGNTLNEESDTHAVVGVVKGVNSQAGGLAGNFSQGLKGKGSEAAQSIGNASKKAYNFLKPNNNNSETPSISQKTD